MNDNTQNDDNSQKQTGTVKWFNPTKGFGFIEPDNAKDGQSGDKNDLFVHITDIIGSPLKEGERVSFEIAQGPKGPNAVKVTREGEEASEASESNPFDSMME